MSIFRVNVDKAYVEITPDGHRKFYQPGAIVEITELDKTAKRWIEAGWLVPIINEVASEPDANQLEEFEEDDEENVNG